MPVVLGAASAITSRRVAAYGLLSTAAAVAVVLNAFRQRSNFYSATVMLGGSNGCMMVLLNFGLFLSLCIGKACQKILFGDLRAVEVEHLHERLWYAITESLLAMTIFRDDFDSSFALLFGTLLFLKVFHWLSADRVEYMEQSPSVSRLFHVRMIAVLSMLFELDLFLATFAVELLIVDHRRKGIMIMFASEFFILGAMLWSTIAKYLINCQDMRSDEPWQAKSMYVFFVDLVTDFLKLATYVACFCLILSYYGLPLNIIRDVYMTGRSFFGRLRDFIKYRAATRNMDTRFPDATMADLRNMSDGTCIICREEMVARADVPGEGRDGEEDDDGADGERPDPEPGHSSGLNETPKKLPCGHIFHFHCLRSWLERQQSCPTCRQTVFAPVPGDEQQASGLGGQVAPGAMRGEQQQQQQQRGNTQHEDGRLQGQHADGDSATQSARERLHGFLQQLQTDAQRPREDAQNAVNRQQNSTAGSQERASGESTGRPNTAQVPDGTQGDMASSSVPTSGAARSPARRMLVNSLFAHHDVLSARRREGEGSTSALPPPPLLQGLRSSQVDRADDLHTSWIPPAPWTMRSQGTDALLSQSQRTVSSNGASASAPGHERKEPEETSAKVDRAGEQEAVVTEGEAQAESRGSLGDTTIDPADAREAARSAALRRFAARQSDRESDQAQKHPRTDHAAETKTPETPTQPPLPGNPRLIPLFDVAAIEDFESHHAPRLPFPVLDRRQAHASVDAVVQHASQELSNVALSASDLEGLSKQTRQGLEERLRLLYRVEGAVGHLVEELTRALSVLPENDTILPSSKESENGKSGAPSDSQVKGKAPAEGLRATLANDTHRA